MPQEHIVDCPYCGFGGTIPYHSVRLPLFSWPLPRDKQEYNPIVETEVRMCPKCFFGFNASPMTREMADIMYGDYVYIKPTKGFGSSVHEGFIDLVGRGVPKSAKILEIGSSDGYLLSRLKENGYVDLSGMDQNPRAPDGLGIPIKKEKFSKDTVFEEPVDVILMQNMFQYFARPWDILETIGNKLQPGGMVLIDAPTYTNGIHHQHSSFMTVPFLDAIAVQSGLCIDELSYSRDSYQAVLSKGKPPKRYLSGDELTEESLRVMDVIAHFADEEMVLRNRLNDFVRGAGGGPVFWYGTGLAAHLLSGYLEPGASDGREFIVVDGDKDRKSLIYTPTGTEVHWAGECLAGKDVESIVLATSLHAEVRKYLDSLNCRAARTFVP